MQSALDKAGTVDALRKEVENKDATITSLHQQLEEMENKWVGISNAKKLHRT